MSQFKQGYIRNVRREKGNALTQKAAERNIQQKHLYRAPSPEPTTTSAGVSYSN